MDMATIGIASTGDKSVLAETKAGAASAEDGKAVEAKTTPGPRQNSGPGGSVTDKVETAASRTGAPSASAAFVRQAQIEQTLVLAKLSPAERGEARRMIAELTAQGVNIVGVARPTVSGSSSVTYRFGTVERGIELEPGVGRSNEILCLVPQEFRDRSVRAFECSHRQDPSTDRRKKGGYDPNPGMTCVNFHSREDGSWRALLPPWGSHAPTQEGRARGAMFAENYAPAEPGSGRNPAESDYRSVDMRSWGGSPSYSDIKAGNSATKSVLCDFVRIACPVNAVENGVFDPIWLHQLDVFFQSRPASTTRELMFTPGAEFAPWGSTPCFVKYGGGQETDGTFKEALELRPDGSGGAGAAKLPPQAKMRPDGSLEIDLTPWAGKVLCGVEVMAGDSKPDGKTNADGGKGTSGWSVLSMAIESATGADWITREANVPPNGIILGSPSQANEVIVPGTKLVIKAESKGEPPTEMDPKIYSVCYVPGLRLGFRESGEQT